MSQFGRGESDGVIGARKFANGVARIAGHTGGDIHGDHLRQRKADIDLANAFQHPAGGRPGDAGTEQRVDQKGSGARLGGNLLQDGATADRQHLVISRGVALQIVGRGEQHHVQFLRMEPRLQLPRDRHAIAAVIALAAQHHHALFGDRLEPGGQKLGHTMRGILHQDNAGNPLLDGLAIHLAHFRRCESLHNLRATTIVISSCNSPARSTAPPPPWRARLPRKSRYWRISPAGL